MKTCNKWKRAVKNGCILLVCVCLFSLTGCIAYFENPLSSTGEQVLDPDVFGSWYWQDEDESGLVHIGKKGKSDRFTLLMIEFSGSHQMKHSGFKGHTTAFGGSTYLNLTPLEPEKNETRGYLLVKYQMLGGRLGVSLMDAAPVEQAVRKGGLKGKTDDQKKHSPVYVTEDTAGVRQFILANDAALFKEVTFMSPLKLPTPEDTR